ncbi:MAG: carboxymuconolactone decarboxylase family protein [Bacteroidota bacterium]
MLKKIARPYRFISTGTFYRYLKLAVKGAGGMVLNRKKALVSKQFGERIFLAVTGVNGCRYCSFYHAKLALTSGMDRSEISSMLSGEFGLVPEEEALALVFAQHYADTGGNPEPEAEKQFLEYYGEEKARVIRSHIAMITVGNFYGTAFDGLQSRLRLRPIEGSRLRDELGITLGILFMLPVLLIDIPLSKVL